jgi:hypothetical protein
MTFYNDAFLRKIFQVFFYFGRLENRTNRPHVELCRDEPMDGLIQEVETLRETIHKLTLKLDHSRWAYHNLGGGEGEGI